MKNLKLKTWQKLSIGICGVASLSSLFLLVPFVQNLILDFGENFIVHRPLTRPVWIERFIEWGSQLFALFTFPIFAILISCCRIEDIATKVKLKLTIFSKLFRNPFIGIPVLYIVLLTLNFSLICLAYMIPTDIIKKNVEKSVPYFKISSEYGYQNLMGDGSTLDDFTDAHMLLEAAHKSNKPFYVAAMLNEYPSTTDNFQGQPSKETYYAIPYETLVQIYGNKHTSYTSISYGRFWHGYLIFLKPLLLYTTYNGIRVIQMYSQILLIFILFALLLQKKQSKYILPFILTWLFFNPSSLFLSMNFNTDFMLTLFELIIITYFCDDYASSKKIWIYHFFTVGTMIAYFDYLVTPLITFGIPIVFLLSMNSKNFKDDFISLVKNGTAWATGYITMWLGKWIVGSLITGTNILENAKAQLIYRTISPSPWESDATYLDVVIGNLKNCNILFFLFILLSFFIFNLTKKYKIEKKNYILFFTALLPFAWYFVAQNHSLVHRTLTTFRLLGISIYSLSIFINSMKKENVVTNQP